MIKLIAKLYQVEKPMKEASPEARYLERQARAKPIIGALRVWLDETHPKVAPKTTLGKALHYLDHQWSRLIGYLDNSLEPYAYLKRAFSELPNAKDVDKLLPKSVAERDQ